MKSSLFSTHYKGGVFPAACRIAIMEGKVRVNGRRVWHTDTCIPRGKDYELTLSHVDFGDNCIEVKSRKEMVAA